ncbi:hypothetical protein [Rufibacter aurantiacus]|uniref:hypothetical protein n=1 Tax=Rufibacter aurantiacus TaxID=2817374 RepID=UPI001B30D294|nr:hypothetical protein [Rufibacter aurantiacus]
MVNPIEGLESANVYLVRDLRPVMALPFKDRASLQKLELYAWCMGPAAGKNGASNPAEPNLKSGDCFVFDAIRKGEQISFALRVK